MGNSQANSINQNLTQWATCMASLNNCHLQGDASLLWYNTNLPHPMYNFGCNVANDNPADLKACIESFQKSQSPFYFSNGVWHEGKRTSEQLRNSGADFIGLIDGMLYDLDKGIPKLEEHPDLKIGVVETEAQYKDFGQVTSLASGQDESIGPKFFSKFENLKNAPLTLLVSYIEDKPVGCSMIYTPEGDTAGNYWAWVLPEYRKQGINSAMVVKRMQMAKDAGYKYLVAQCMDTSTRLYSRLSFEKICELDMYGKVSY